MKKTVLLLFIFTTLFSCIPKEKSLPLLAKSAFEKVVNGKEVSIYTLKNGDLTMQVTNLGGRVVSLWVPDRDGQMEDIVLGNANIDSYLNPSGERYLGPIVGRYANRIAKGQFTLDGATYQLPINNNGQTLHGGLKGLDLVVWNVDSFNENQITLSYLSPDGEDGFPGNLTLRMIYTLTPDNEFKIEYEATTDKTTVINLSHHGVFNLKGEGNGTITDHILKINASGITPVDSVLIPTGEILSIENTPFDFRKPMAIGDRINEAHEQLKNGAGYDHNWVVDRNTEKEVEFVASIYEPTNGRIMEVWSDQPGIQFYSGNFFDGKSVGKYGRTQNYREGFALETQHFPDSPNHESFPSTRLDPEDTYSQICIYKFKIKEK